MVKKYLVLIFIENAFFKTQGFPCFREKKYVIFKRKLILRGGKILFGLFLLLILKQPLG